jgi:hypothetical protein
MCHFGGMLFRAKVKVPFDSHLFYKHLLNLSVKNLYQVKCVISKGMLLRAKVTAPNGAHLMNED